MVVANEKLYVNRIDGFMGTGLRKDEYVCDCSDIDDIIVFLKDGTYVIKKVAEKDFVGKNIVHIAVFKKNDKRTIYNVVYYDGNTGFTMMKRCPITGITRDKIYNIGKEHEHTRILYMSANPNGEAETIKVSLKPRPRLKKPVFDVDFSELSIKGRNAAGNILSKNAVHRITMKERGVSTLGGRKIWFDEDVKRLNADARGEFLGEFSGEDMILLITKSGNFRVSNFDLENHFEDDLMIIEKYRPNKIWSAAYYDADQEYYYIKRFQLEPSEKLSSFIGDNPASRLIQIMEVEYPRLELKFGGKNKDRAAEIVEVAEFIGVKSFKAKGKRLSNYEVKVIEQLEPLIPDSLPDDVDNNSEAAAGDASPEPGEVDPEGTENSFTEEGEVTRKKEKEKSKKVVGSQKAEGGSRKAEDGGQRTEDDAETEQKPEDIPMEIVIPKTEKKEVPKKPEVKKDKPVPPKKKPGNGNTESNGQMKLEL